MADPNDFEIVHLPDPSTIPAPVQPKQTLLAQPPPLSKTTKVDPNNFEIVHLPSNGSSFQAPQINPSDITAKQKALGPPIESQTPGQDFETVRRLLPFLGSLIGPEGGAAGAFASQALAPKPDVGQLGTDLALNSVIPAGIESSPFQSLLKSGKGLLGKIASKIVNTNNPTVASGLASKAAEFTSPSTPALQMGQTLSEDVAPNTTSLEDLATSQKALDKAKANLDKLKPQQPSDIIKLQNRYNTLAKASTTPSPEDDLITTLQNHLDDLKNSNTINKGMKASKTPSATPGELKSIQDQIDQLQNQKLSNLSSGLYSSDLSAAEEAHQTATASHAQLKANYNPSTNPSILDAYAEGKTPDQVAKKLISDPREVQKLNLATGTPELTEQLALNHAVSQGYNDVSKTFDPDKILKELGDNKEGYDAALLSGTQERLTDFLQTAKSLEPSKQTGMMQYLKHRLVFDLGAFGVGHAIAGGGLPGLAVGGTALVLSNQAISRLMSSETLGNLALQSLKLAPDSPVSPLIAKSLVNGLKGVSFGISSDGGKTTQNATVGPDGSIVPLH